MPLSTSIYTVTVSPPDLSFKLMAKYFLFLESENYYEIKIHIINSLLNSCNFPKQ